MHLPFIFPDHMIHLSSLSAPRFPFHIPNATSSHSCICSCPQLTILPKAKREGWGSLKSTKNVGRDLRKTLVTSSFVFSGFVGCVVPQPVDLGSLLAIHKHEAGCVIPAATTKPHIQHLKHSNILLTQNPKWMLLIRRYFSHRHSEIQSISFHVMAPPSPRASESSLDPPHPAGRRAQRIM